MYLIEDINGLQYKVDSLAKFCKEKEITLRLLDILILNGKIWKVKDTKNIIKDLK